MQLSKTLSSFRLLHVVLFATGSLLALKVTGLVTGLGSFAFPPANASSEAPAAAAPAPESDFLGPLVNLEAEAEALRKAQEEAQGGHGGGHGAPADGHGAPADGHGAPADDHGAPADDHAAPADDHAAPADDHAAPADDHAAPADDHGGGGHDAHGGKEKSPVTTVRPQEYQPQDSSSTASVLESLAARRQELGKREEDISVRLKLLEAAETKLNDRIAALKELEAQLGGLAKETVEEEDKKLKGLVTIYENMKPKAAARVFNDLDMNILISLAAEMNPRKLSSVLAVMAPDKAAKLTAALAGDQSPREIRITRDALGPAASQPALEDLPKIMPAEGGG